MSDDPQDQFKQVGRWLLIVVPLVIIGIVLLFGVTLPWKLPPTPEQTFEQQSAAFAKRQQHASVARTTMIHLREAALQFKRRNGRWPSALTDMPRSEWSVVPPQVGALWKFEIIEGDELLRAISTEAMPDGAGQTIIYDLVTHEWEGYGMEAPPVKQPPAEQEE